LEGFSDEFLVFYEKKHHDCKIVDLRQKRHEENKEDNWDLGL